CRFLSSSITTSITSQSRCIGRPAPPSGIVPAHTRGRPRALDRVPRRRPDTPRAERLLGRWNPAGRAQWHVGGWTTPAGPQWRLGRWAPAARTGWQLGRRGPATAGTRRQLAWRRRLIATSTSRGYGAPVGGGHARALPACPAVRSPRLTAHGVATVGCA